MAVTPADAKTTATAMNATLTSISVDSTSFRRQQGFDLAYFQSQLQTQGQKLEDQLRAIQQNENLSDTERMFEMQMLMNTWSTITNLRTNMMKSISDTLKSIIRNVA
ncbi:EscF/YscF/HrpA family type III secretion system needle major subunit [Rhizobium alvei]|jgi:type III secretion apparatus needle protein|uniref:EscF/YscF/HrpA family type III secretion system needle major subunit n=1 Tax=Rhizobium alvei TaxID=1132659 RepID=A0ABT8YT10_9HYPH|nr:EscF/YscF/HrpA family type III secretion system needle major subunit [Rhizobium alvei]MDO6966487.1 EscF/YscF/HrpA family type III secretion system needle major subunit [Rhizobium alvei]